MSSPAPGAWRIGDRERERAAGRLADHYAEGRLSADEHAERLDAAWSARTEADLVLLFGDLPEPAAGRSRPAPGPRRSARWSRPPLVPLAVLLVVVALVAGPPVLLVVLLVGVLVMGRGCRARA